MFSILNLGFSAMSNARLGMSVLSHNQASELNKNYHRQEAHFVTNPSHLMNGHAFGQGVALERVSRSIDRTVDSFYNTAISESHFFDAIAGDLHFAQIQLNELEKNSGLGDAISSYFKAWKTLSSGTSGDTALADTNRSALLDSAKALADKIHQVHGFIENVRNDDDTKLSNDIRRVNSIIRDIAKINGRIGGRTDDSSNPNNDALDSLDGLVSELSEYADTRVFYDGNGNVSVSMGNHLVVQGENVHTLGLRRNRDNNNHYSVVIESSKEDRIYGKEGYDITEQFTRGSILGTIKSRDVYLKDVTDNLDKLARALIFETNRIHSSGKSLEKISHIVSSGGVFDPGFRFESGISDRGKLDFDIVKGSFRIEVRDSSDGSSHFFNILLDPRSDSLNSIIEKINSSVVGVVASSAMGGRLSLSAGEGLDFSFVDDTSGFLAAIGLNGFFQGSSARTIKVDERLLSDGGEKNLKRIVTGVTGKAGDNTKSMRMYELRDSMVDGRSLKTIYNHTITELTLNQEHIIKQSASAGMTKKSFFVRKQAISGVNNKEQDNLMTQYQAMFQAGAKLTKVAKDLFDVLLSTV